ncbi:MAG: T9SS type A sorting domain-containing protein [Ignavibacteria bacterium]|nr:T9SS type A sorting domain-containing protein [Ignavibacteria bacterium]
MWEKTYDNNGNEIAMDGCIDEDGGILIIGCSQLNRPYKTVVLKLDKEGNQLWHKTFGGIGGTVISTKDKNNLFIIDYADKHQIILIKLNEKGNDVWQKSVGENVYPKNSMLLNNNNILISGYKGNKDNSIKYNPYLVKVDSSGNKIWEYIGDSPNSCYYSICSISDTLFAASGNFDNQLGVDIINNHGELVNSVRFPERNGVINSIITTKDNNLFLTGSITPPYKLSQLYTLLLKHPYIITSVEDEPTENIANPEQPFSIFPNPTNSTATLQYTIDTPTMVKIELVDFMGMKVSELENAFKEAGNYSTFINFEGLTIAKGMYFVRFIANGNVFVSKIIFC